jgi:hypothetical protein
MKRSILIRRIRCGHLEAVVASIQIQHGEPRLGVFFHRLEGDTRDRDSPLFDADELLVVARLAELAHHAVRLYLEASPSSPDPSLH